MLLAFGFKKRRQRGDTAGALAVGTEQESRRTGEADGLRILLVDDEPTILALLARALKDHHTTTVPDPERAKQLLEDHAYDLVISDNSMPTMSGTEFLAHVEVFHPDVRRVLYSGTPPADLPSLSQQGIIEHFVEKPALREIISLCNSLRDELGR